MDSCPTITEMGAMMVKLTLTRASKIGNYVDNELLKPTLLKIADKLVT